VDENGAGADLFWTQRLLERAGFNISPNNTGCVVQVEVVRRGLWRVQGIEAGSLAQVLALAQKFGLTARGIAVTSSPNIPLPPQHFTPYFLFLRR
jgi:hypothetical protein